LLYFLAARPCLSNRITISKNFEKSGNGGGEIANVDRLPTSLDIGDTPYL